MKLNALLHELRVMLSIVNVGRVAREWAAPFGWKAYLRPGDVILTRRHGTNETYLLVVGQEDAVAAIEQVHDSDTLVEVLQKARDTVEDIAREHLRLEAEA